MQDIQQIIDEAWENRNALQPDAAPATITEAVAEAINQLDAGKLRVAEKIDGQWVTHQWLKKAVLLSFRLHENAPARRRRLRYYDKVPNKFADYDRRALRARRLPGRAAGCRPAGRLHRPQRGADALVRQHRRLCR
jgi:2,3,4,5-tetrahydropyridine-2-carboxylate N-succinyltransferase